MKYGCLILEKKEYVYLKRILNISGYTKDQDIDKSLVKLSNELKTASILDDKQVPKDVVRFNSIVKITLNNGWERILQVVIPTEKDATLNKISVLAPMGAALFGYSTDDVVQWEFPGGKQDLKIVEVKKEDSEKRINMFI